MTTRLFVGRFRVRLDSELRQLVHGLRRHVSRRWRHLLCAPPTAVSAAEVLRPAPASAPGCSFRREVIARPNVLLQSR